MYKCTFFNLCRFDQFSHSEVSQRELRDFELRWNIPIVKICNTPTATSGTGLSDIITVMNNICELLWERDVQKAEAVWKVLVSEFCAFYYF